MEYGTWNMEKIAIMSFQEVNLTSFLFSKDGWQWQKRYHAFIITGKIDITNGLNVEIIGKKKLFFYGNVETYASYQHTKLIRMDGRYVKSL